jgi:hypothetical protein
MNARARGDWMELKIMSPVLSFDPYAYTLKQLDYLFCFGSVLDTFSRASAIIGFDF